MKVARRNESFPLRRLEQAEREAAHRAVETPEQSQARRRQHAEYLASQRAVEIPEQSQDRRRQHAEYLASQRTDETPEQSQVRRRQHEQSRVDGWCDSVIGRDFKQTLPVIERGTAVDEINACLKSKVEKLHLTTNMRVQLFSDVESGAFAQKLLEIGEGHLDTDQEGMVLFTQQFCHTVESEDELIE
ncbi:hypothetical protein JTB14_004892 [Gonioctena quinquepunctata]|nr:hypothetical protein JTB14_004892 [Gonioctena quinquepunctata]